MGGQQEEEQNEYENDDDEGGDEGSVDAWDKGAGRSGRRPSEDDTYTRDARALVFGALAQRRGILSEKTICNKGARKNVWTALQGMTSSALQYSKQHTRRTRCNIAGARLNFDPVRPLTTADFVVP